MRAKCLGALALFLFLVATSTFGQSKQSVKPAPKPTALSASELTRLRDEYIKATREYQTSLKRLLILYQESARKAEERVTQSRKLFADGLIDPREVEKSEQALSDANLKVSGVQQQIATADTTIAQTLIEISKPETKAKLAREYKRASARRPTCRNWTLTASRQQRGSTVTFAYKLVCKD
jgi:hypothetical protein